MHSFRYSSWTLVPLAVACGVASAQNDSAAPATRVPERCIQLDRVSRTEVIDDRTLIFHMRSGQIYLNYLERECPRLASEERFMYSPTGNRLCDIDTITVLERWGFGLTRGFTCGLGEFHPISEVELADLKRMGGDSSAIPGRDRGEFEVVPVDPDELEEDGETAAVDEPSGSGDDDAAESDPDGER